MSDETFRWIVASGVGLVAVSFLIIAIVAIVLAMVVMKLRKKIEPLLEAAAPIVRNVSETTAILKPRVVRMSEQAVEISQLVVAEAHRYSGVSKDVAGKVKEVSELVVAEAHRYSDVSKDVAVRAKLQVARIDGVVDYTVDQVEDAGAAVKSAVLKPVRVADGIFSGVRTAILTYARGQKSPVNSATLDEEMFI